MSVEFCSKCKQVTNLKETTLSGNIKSYYCEVCHMFVRSVSINQTNSNQEGLVGKRIYVGNVPFGATEEELKSLFSPHGTVTAVDIVKDRATGRPKGFCFIDMDSGAEDAITKLAGVEMGGRKLFVNEAREKGQGGPQGGGRPQGGYAPRNDSRSGGYRDRDSRDSRGPRN